MTGPTQRSAHEAAWSVASEAVTGEDACIAYYAERLRHERDAEITRFKSELSDQKLNGEAIRLIRQSLARVGIEQTFASDLGDAAAAEIARLRTENQSIVAAFRVNMMRLSPDYTHAEFDRRIAEIFEKHVTASEALNASNP